MKNPRIRYFISNQHHFITMKSTLYVTYVKWSDKAKEKGLDFFFTNWMTRHEELCKKYEIHFIKWGLPLGTVEDHAFLYETTSDTHNFMEFKGEISNFNGEKLWEYSKTNIIVCQ